MTEPAYQEFLAGEVPVKVWEDKAKVRVVQVQLNEVRQVSLKPTMLPFIYGCVIKEQRPF